MKKTFLAILISISISFSSSGQAPEGIKYQAVIRNASNIIITNQPVGIQFEILEGGIGGQAVYTETFAPTTNAYGLVNVEMGTGNTTDDFSSIPWEGSTYYVRTSIDISGGSSYVVMGTSQFMSVPYALFARTSGNVINDAVNDADSDPINEIQQLSRVGDSLLLSQGGSVFLGGPYAGDVKTGFISSDHAGWYLMDGRDVGSLPQLAQARATSLGFSSSLPDARGRFLKGKEGTDIAGSGGGSDSLYILQANIPDYLLSGSTSTDGMHTHAGTAMASVDHSHPFSDSYLNGGTRRVGKDGGLVSGENIMELQSSVTNLNKTTTNAGTHTHTLKVETDGEHMHTVGVNSGGNGVALYNNPAHLVTNMFIYLGN